MKHYIIQFKGPTIQLLRGEGGLGAFEKKYPASACVQEKIPA